VAFGVGRHEGRRNHCAFDGGWHTDWIRLGGHNMKPTESETPNLIENERKTTDLCGQEYTGARCMKTRGHEGRHECLFWRGSESLLWE
jgi:hypothetical protein